MIPYKLHLIFSQNIYLYHLKIKITNYKKVESTLSVDNINILRSQGRVGQKQLFYKLFYLTGHPPYSLSIDLVPPNQNLAPPKHKNFNKFLSDSLPKTSLDLTILWYWGKMSLGLSHILVLRGNQLNTLSIQRMASKKHPVILCP